jgi:opine dehydrogenase
MRVAILGAGGIGLSGAALARSRGHDPVLWSPSLAANGTRTAEVTDTGLLKSRHAVTVAAGVAEALAGAELVVIAVPGYAHRQVLDLAAPHLRPGQIVAISSHCSFSALFLSKRLAALGVELPIVAWGTTVTTTRRYGPLETRVTNLRKKVDAAAVPVSESARAIAACAAVFGDVFQERADLLAVTLSNLNPQSHAALTLCNLTRIECAEDWGNYQYITPTVGRLTEALDDERVRLAKRFGLAVRTIREHYSFSFGVPVQPISQSAAEVHARGTAPLGPKTLETRYVTEDLPYGIAVIEAVASLAGMGVPLHTAALTLFDTLYGRDFRAGNDLLVEIGLASLTPERLHDLARNGWPLP